MAKTALLNQVFDITLSTPDASGNEVTLDSPIAWACSDDTVYQIKNVSTDGKTGQLKAIALSQKDPAGNDIPVRCSFSGDGDPSQNVKPLNAVTEDLFAAPRPDNSAEMIVLTMSEPHDEAAARA